MTVLYHTGIIIFAWLVRLGSLFNAKARKLAKGNKETWKVLDRIDAKDKVIWFHCASLGEFEQGRPIIQEIKKNTPHYKILLTFFSPSGYEIRKNYDYADFVTYFPFDTPRNARKFLEKAKPEKAFFVKYEFWYFFMRELHRKKVETYMVSGMFRKDQYFFKWYGKSFRKMLDWFDHFFIQDYNSFKLLEYYGYKNITLSGDTRLDRVIDIVKNAKELPLVEQLRGNEFLFIAGSSWKKDEELLFRYYRESNIPFKMVVAPHEVHPSNIQRIQEELADFKTLKYSQANENNIAGTDILIIDSIGLLASLYRYGDIAYIGGGFGKGIHNLLEAATWGIPVIFGPNHDKFKEAKGLIDMGGGFTIQDYPSLKNTLKNLLNNKKTLKNAGASAEKYIKKNAGATDIIIEKIFF